jgi:hypothetical protein
MFKLWFDLSMLGIETQHVIWLRSMKIAAGGKPGEREARRMVIEKAIVAGEAGFALAIGKSMNSVISGYRKKVRANRRRLSH